MATPNAMAQTELILSRDELLCILPYLDAESLPGIDTEPGPPRSPAEQAVATEVAIRGLCARGLAAYGEQRALRLHDDLLTMIGTCVYPQSALFIFHWPRGAEAPSRYFGHTRDQHFVVHTRPDAVLHRLTMATTKAAFLDSALAFCNFSEPGRHG